MKAVVISLARESDRRDYVRAQLDRFGIEHYCVEAVDGRQLSSQAVKDMVSPSLMAKHQAFGSTWVTVNAIACAASHRRAYEYIVKNVPTYKGPWLILEDDADLHPGIDAIWKSSASEMRKQNLDAVLFYFSVVQDLRLRVRSSTPIAAKRRLYEWNGVPAIASSVAYMLSHVAARNLLECQTPLSYTADEWIHFYEEEAVQRVRLVYPFAVTTGLLESTLGSQKRLSFRRRLVLQLSQLIGKSRLLRNVFLFFRKWDWSNRIKVVKETC